MKHLYPLIILVFCCVFIGQSKAQSQIAFPVTPTTATAAADILLAPANLNFSESTSAPFRYGDKVYFTVSVPKKGGVGKVSRLYSALKDEPAVPQLINPKEDDMNAEEATLNLGGDRIYYTVYKETAGGKQPQSEIWYRNKDYDGTWGHVITLPKPINEMGVINKQPTCGYDFFLKKEVLYFSSNRQGGKGGFDIWYCSINRDGTFNNPINASFNTPNDEVTPFFYTHAQMVFFSSDMPGGVGGFDIYRTARNQNGAWLGAENLSSINTSFDEIYFNYHQPSQTCYFTSNRPETCKNLKDNCPNFAIFKGSLSGCIIVSTMNSIDSASLYGCNIELENLETGVIEMTILQSEENTVELPILPSKKYRLIVSRKGYYPVFLQLESMFTDFAHPIRKTVYLKPMK